MVISRSRERGAATLHWVGVTAISALVVVGVGLAATDAKPGGIVTTAVCTVKTMSPCAAPVAEAPPSTQVPPPTADTGDRRNQEGQTRDDRRGRGSDKAPDDPGTTGPANDVDGLGNPVPGTSVPTPAPPPWQPADGGAGEYDSSTAWPWDYGKKVAVELAANAVAGKWPDAARNLSHYLANTGEPLQQDVNRILHDVPSFQTAVDEVRTSLGETAVRQAKASGATGPVTFPISTDWMGANLGENQNWFYALGSITYNVTGQVTVYPPTSPGGAWRYETSTAVNIADQYNWDRGKSTDIGPFNVPDSELARLHLQGLAREYRNEGTSDTTTTEGTVP